MGNVDTGNVARWKEYGESGDEQWRRESARLQDGESGNGRKSRE